MAGGERESDSGKEKSAIGRSFQLGEEVGRGG
jgi:hypothetical protein